VKEDVDRRGVRASREAHEASSEGQTSEAVPADPLEHHDRDGRGTVARRKGATSLSGSRTVPAPVEREIR